MSINGPTTWNDTVMVGNRVTKFPVNLPAWQMLPDRTIRNWADMTSYTTYNKPNMTPLESFLASNITDPNHISQWDPMLFSLGCPQMYQNNMMTNPFLTQMGIQQAMNMGYQRAMMNRMNSMIQNMARALGSLETQLTNLIKNDKLTDKQKEKLQEKLDEVKELKERIQEAIQNQASIEELEALGGELVELQKSISEVIKEIAEEVKESDKEDDDDVKPKDAKEDDETSDDKKTSKTEHEAKVKDMNDICRRLHTAVSGPGTDYDGPNGLKTVLEVGVDEDHIVELFEAWDKSYAKLGDNADDDGGLIETLMDDCEGDEKEEIAGRIIDLLEKRADKLGIDVQSEVAAARVAAAGERHWYTAYIKVRDDDAITTAVNALYKKVKEANDKNISDADKKADKTKAEDKKKANEKAQEAKATFLADMREIWDDDKLEISDKVQYKDGKFTIRIQGEVYEASSFKALVKKLEKDDLDPKKYLAKQKVDTKA